MSGWFAEATAGQGRPRRLATVTDPRSYASAWPSDAGLARLCDAPCLPRLACWRYGTREAIEMLSHAGLTLLFDAPCLPRALFRRAALPWGGLFDGNAARRIAESSSKPSKSGFELCGLLDGFEFHIRVGSVQKQLGRTALSSVSVSAFQRFSCTTSRVRA